MTHVNHQIFVQSGVDFAALLSTPFFLQVVKTMDVGFVNRSVYFITIFQCDSPKEIVHQRNEFLRTRETK